jgi:dethiobiotin synthetase
MRLFVTGTDTGVGKSVVTACLARAARLRGTVLASKPVASGVLPGTAGEDAELLGQAAGHPPSGLVRYEAPLSPHRAALLEGRILESEALLTFISSLQADTVLVEGVGGWRVPISTAPPLWVSDLARAAGGPVVVVAADRLGTLNHTLLTVERILQDGFSVAGVALNRGTGPPELSRDSNQADLQQLLAVPVVAVPPLSLTDAHSMQRAGQALLRGMLGWEFS